VRLQGSFEEIYSNSKKGTKLIEERQGFKVILRIPQENTGSMHKIRRKQELAEILDPRSRQ
jgi:hypothetical protein